MSLRQRTWPPWLLALLLGLVALPPRLVGLADFLTTDEAYHWIGRVERFSAALADGRWLATSQTGHPGVTVMWLGSLGLALERAALANGTLSIPTTLHHLAWLRLPHALLEATLIPVAYLLMRRLIHPTSALLGALLWASSPYLIAHSRLLHLDGLLTLFVTFSVLLLLVAINDQRPTTLRQAQGRLNDQRPTTNDPSAGSGQAQQPTTNEDGRQTTDDRRQSSILNRQSSILNPQSSIVHRGWLLASGICAGLALLTKAPALILLPFAGVCLLGAYGVQRINWRTLPFTFAHLQSSTVRYAIWLGTALLLVFALWPALWADAPRTLANYGDEIVSNGGRPNGDGQFFLGQAVADPGPLFYPLASLLRTTPMLLLGLLVLPWAWRSIAHRERRSLAWLLGFVLFWGLVMTLGPKKFDRYLLPIWPTLCILAGAGLGGVFQWMLVQTQYFASRRPATSDHRTATTVDGRPKTEDERPPTRQQTRDKRPYTLSMSCLLSPVSYLLSAGLLGIELAQPLLAHPYYLSYYNPLLGGGAVAQQVLLIGWGEGMDQVGAYLRSQPDIQGGQVLSALPPTLQPFVPVPVRDVATLADGPANYAVVYRESLQRGAYPAIYASIRQTVPLHTVTINGIAYAWIHQVPKPFSQPVDAQFGNGLHLRGVTISRGPGQLIVTPAWDVRAQPDADYTLFLHLLDAKGRVAQVDVAPGGGAEPPTSEWQPGRQIAVPLGLGLPASLPAGSYRLTLGLYTTQGRVPPQGGTLADPALAGGDALLIGTVELP